MKDDNIHMNELFVKYLNNTASDEELRIVFEYISRNDTAAKELSQMRKLYTEIADNHNFDHTKSLDAIRGRIKQSPKTFFHHFIFPIGAAAAFILIYIGYSLFFVDSSHENNRIVNSIDSDTSFYFTDSTYITLYPQSCVKFQDFSHHHRNVQLEGEAFFNVAKHSSPFRVSVQDVFVTALGTSFFIAEDSVSITIQMKEGKVLVVENNNEYTIFDNEVLTLYRQIDSSYKVNKQLTDAFLNDSVFKFVDIALIDAVNSLNKSFTSTIVIDEALDSVKINATFHMSDSIEIPDMLSRILNTEYTVTNDTVLIGKK
ncbi:MAG: FecR domain-containing protein [Bacteroidales bacterium]